ncbi:NAD-dependent epimerase/dehydratase family protein [Actinoplanes rectilineatus]|uniref:NAD-dependent epimerase/dehydratase family protein n=1 Tax=Actinoplanes rectilineatus TaxID=113571 RepID=UPI0005F289BE|nr:NAD-dependent epimerase/dehydratase family protein [Actinoplanes rectilineatus]
MPDHVVLGAGSIGSNVALLLADRGETVRIVTRGGAGPDHPLIERVAADAADAERLTTLSRGAKVIYHCANPASYTTWHRLLPPLQTAAIAAAQANDAVLANTGSTYAYGPQPGTLTEHTPLSATGRKGLLRKENWERSLAAGIRTFEARSSDFIGRDAYGYYAMILEPALKRGGAAWVPGHLDMPHTFTYNRDVASTLVALAADGRAWGRAWHVPSPPPVTLRELAARYAAAAGKPPIRLIPLPRFAMRLAGTVVPMAREIAEMDYQWYAPLVMDATETMKTFDLTATDLDVAIRDQVSALVS